MGHEFGKPPLDAEQCPAPSVGGLSRRWSVAGGPLAPRCLFLLSAAFGVAVSFANVSASGVRSAGMPFWSEDSGYWPISAALVALVAAAWLAGAVISLLMLVRLPRWNRQEALFSPRWIGALAAFGFGPLLAALFFLAIGIGSRAWDRAALPALGVAAVALAIFAYARQAFARFGELLLLSLFVWLAVLVVPAFQSDPVSRHFADFLLGLMRWAGLLA